MANNGNGIMGYKALDKFLSSLPSADWKEHPPITARYVEQLIRNSSRGITSLWLPDGYLVVRREPSVRMNVAYHSADPRGENVMSTYKWMFPEDEFEAHRRELEKLHSMRASGVLLEPESESVYRLAVRDFTDRHSQSTRIAAAIGAEEPILPMLKRKDFS